MQPMDDGVRGIPDLNDNDYNKGWHEGWRAGCDAGTKEEHERWHRLHWLKGAFYHKYRTFPWYEDRLGGHLSVGRFTLFGFNAMHVALNIRTGHGYLCLHPSVKMHERWWPWYIYLSRDATPGSARWGIGPGYFNRYPERRRRTRRGGSDAPTTDRR